MRRQSHTQGVCCGEKVDRDCSSSYRSLDLHEGEAHAGLPVLRRLEDQVVQRLTDLGVLAVERVREICEYMQRRR